MRMMRWRVEGNLPDLRKMVIIVAPHTSNWDFFVGISAALAIDVQANWFGKHTIFRGPAGRVLRALGGIPVVRSSRQNVVEQWLDEFARRDQLVVGLAPEGTRKLVEEWRTGFWYLAKGAHVAIVPVGLDYRLRRAIIGPPYWPTDDLEVDLVRLKSFFANVVPRHPGRRQK
jgi:1-acyl-sn-glycerol-3-phosphate acyltransferase